MGNGCVSLNGEERALKTWPLDVRSVLRVWTLGIG